ncbi:MAG: VgrG protein [Chloroflexi bacterium]|nr:VgrG protein [Chloroflexota bacterium]
MPPNPILTSQIQIKLDGTVIQHDLLTKLVSVIVDQHTYLPGMFALTFFDTDLRLLDRGPFDLTKRVTISGEKEDGTSFPLIDGEITALEPSFNEGMIAEFVVRGYDKSHRLFRETKNRAFVNIKDSDLASQFAGAAGLSAVVDATSIVYDNLIQDNNAARLAYRVRVLRSRWTPVFPQAANQRCKRLPDLGAGPAILPTPDDPGRAGQ